MSGRTGNAYDAGGVVFLSPYRAENEPETAFAGDSAMKWYTRCLAFALKGETFPVTVLTLRRCGRPSMNFDDAGIKVRPVLDARPFFYFWSFLREIGGLSQRVVHVQHELYAYGSVINALLLPFMLFLARVLFRKRVICTMHGVFAPSSISASLAASNRITVPLPVVRVAWWWISAGLCLVSDLVQVHERSHITVLTSAYLCSPHKILLIPIGVREEKRGSPVPSGETVLFFGTLSQRKGIVEFIRAIPEILRRRPESRVIIAGDVPLRLRGSLDVPALCSCYGVDMRRVTLRGFVADDEVSELFSSANVLILPYTVAIAASGPLALALGYGVPVLLSNVFRDDFPDAPCLFKPDPHGIAEMVEIFLSDEKKRREIRAYWAHVASQRTWKQVACDLKSAYMRIA
jgi:glycosyltransferase involved in cell wall biosynthesis